MEPLTISDLQKKKLLKMCDENPIDYLYEEFKRIK